MRKTIILLTFIMAMSNSVCMAQEKPQENNFNIVPPESVPHILPQGNMDNLPVNTNFSSNAKLEEAIQSLNSAQSYVESDYAQVKAQLDVADRRLKLYKQDYNHIKSRLKVINRMLKNLKSAREKIQRSIKIRENSKFGQLGI